MISIPSDLTVIKKQIGDTLYYYGLDVVLNQSELPYTVPAKGQPRPASTTNFTVYADTVTIDGYLMNPGKDVSIIARKIIFNQGAIIDTSGPVAATTYEPGDVVQQANPALGATGTTGNSGGHGSNGGNISLISDEITQADPPSGNQLPINFSIEYYISAQADKATAAMAKAFPGGSIAIQDFNVDLNVLGHASVVDVTANKLAGATEFKIGNCAWNPSTSEVILTILANPISWTSTPKIGGTAFGDIVANGIGLVINIKCDVDLIAKTVTGSSTSTNLINFNPEFAPGSYNWPITGANATLFFNPLKQQLEAALNPYVAQISFDDLFQDNPFNGLLLAKGGQGGRGQDGHAGVQGVQGPKGPNTSSSNVMDIMQSQGGTGGQGGQGGNAGTSGTGGTGGTIALCFMDSCSTVVGLNSGAGDGGNPARPGVGGPGGQGGPGGTFTYIGPPLNGGYSPVPVRQSSTAPQGGPGPQGNPAAFQGAFGQKGTEGTEVVNEKPFTPGQSNPTITAAAYAQFATIEQLGTIQRSITFAYLNAQTATDYQYPIEVANWLLTITSAITDTSFQSSNWSAEDIGLAKGIQAFAANMISHYQKGLDFYGHYSNWVPILTLTSYESRIDEMLDLGKNIEDQFNAYVNEQSSAQQKLDSVKQAAEKIQAAITSDESEIQNLLQQIEEANKQVSSLTNMVQTQTIVVDADETLFTEELRAYVEKQNKCTFSKTLGMITGIIQMGTGMVDGVGLISGAFNAEKEATSALEQFKNCITIVEKVNASVSGFALGFNNVKNALSSAPSPTDDIGLVATDKKQFDQFIQQYLGDFGAAATLKTAVDQLFHIINTLNQTICSYNALYVTLHKKQAELTEKQAQLEKEGALIAKDQEDPGLPGYVSFMQSALSHIQMVLVRMLYEENRALEFWSLKKSPFQVNDLSMAALSQVHENILNEIGPLKDRTSAIFEPFTQEISIAEADYAVAFKMLPETKRLVFNIPVTTKAFLNLYQVMVDKVEISFPDISSKTNTLSVELIHPGSGYQVPQPTASGNEPIEFVHLPRAIIYKIDYANPTNTAGGVIGDPDQGYTGLSPLTTWTLNFDLEGNNWLFDTLDTIKSVNLKFTGTCVGPDAEAEKS